MSLAAYGRELGLNIHSYGSVLTGVMTGGTLGLDVERALPSVVGTTCTPSTFVAVEFGPGGAAADEGREPGVPFEADAETAALDAVEGRAEVDTELEPEAVASTAGEVAVRVPEGEPAIIVVEEMFAVETALSLAAAPVEVAKTELVEVATTDGLSSTSGSAGTKTMATFCTPETVLPDEFEGAA
jgi:hypothetical protein